MWALRSAAAVSTPMTQKEQTRTRRSDTRGPCACSCRPSLHLQEATAVRRRSIWHAVPLRSAAVSASRRYCMTSASPNVSGPARALFVIVACFAAPAPGLFISRRYAIIGPSTHMYTLHTRSRRPHAELCKNTVLSAISFSKSSI